MEETYAEKTIREAKERQKIDEAAAFEARLAKPEPTHRFGVPVGTKNPNSAGFKPGCKKVGGRRKGCKNKFTRVAKDHFIEAFEDSGGVRALTEWGKLNRSEFYKLYGRLIPMEQSVAGPKGAPIPVKMDIEFVKP
jgi:hypothetical protein